MTRRHLHRYGVAFAIAGMLLSTVDVHPAGETPSAFANEAAPAPAISAALTGAAAPTATPAADAPAADDAPKTPPGGDLTNLTLTATGNLSASLLSPENGVADSVSASFKVQTVKGAAVEISVDGKVVPFKRIGERSVDDKTGDTIYTYYGVELAPGPNAVVLTPLGADHLRGTPLAVTVYGPGKTQNVQLTASGRLLADGVSSTDVRVRALDAWGHHAAAGQVVHVTVVSGDVHLVNAGATPAPAASSTASAMSFTQTQQAAQTPTPITSSSPGIQSASVPRAAADVAIAKDGTATIQMMAGLTPGDVVLRADSGDITTDLHVYMAPHLRTPFVNGLITGGMGSVPGIPNAPDTDANGANSRKGRIALYGTGAVGGALASVAYDTADVLDRTSTFGGAFNDDPADRPYAITGDSSTRRDDALSRDHLYARLDSGRDTALWGEFNATTGVDSSALGGFSQLVDGAKLTLGGQNSRLTAFAAKNEVGYDRRVFTPSGLSLGLTVRPDVVVGSEVITLATLDRRTGAILTQTPLMNGVDYSIEYATGEINFIETPLPVDTITGNPNVIVLTYQYDTPGGSGAQTVGGRAETTLGRNHTVKLGIGYVNDSTGAGNVTLATQDLSAKLFGGQLQIVHASSSGILLDGDADSTNLAGGGGALHAAYNRTVGNTRLSFLYDRTGSGYNDPFGGLSTPGLLNEHFTIGRKFTNGDISLDVTHEGNAGFGQAGNTSDNATLSARHDFGKRFSMNASLQRTIETAGGGATTLSDVAATTTTVPIGGIVGLTVPGAYATNVSESSTQVSLGADWKVSKPLDLSVTRLQTLAGQNDIEPTQTTGQLTYDFGSAGKVYLREQFSGAPINSFAQTTQGETAATGGTHLTDIGFERKISSAMSIDEDYALQNTGNGTDIYASTGVREHFAFGKVKGDAFFQHATENTYGATDGTTTDAAGGGFNLYGSSLSYTNASNTFRTSESTQLRTGYGGGVSFQLSAAGALSQSVSLLANLTDARSDGNTQSDERVGLAWRPMESDAGVTLLQYEKLSGTAIDSVAGDNDTESGVLSIEQVLRPRERTEIVGRYAYKVDGDSLYEAHSSLLGLRVDQRVGSRLDFGVEGRRANVIGIDGALSTAFAVEAGMRLGDQTRLGVGYNFSATADPSLATTPQHKGFYVTVTSVLDRVLGWGHH